MKKGGPFMKHRVEVCRSVVSFPSRVRGRALAKNEFGAF